MSFIFHLVLGIMLSPLFLVAVVWWEILSPWLKNRKYKEQKGYEMTREEFLNECRDSYMLAKCVEDDINVIPESNVEFLANILFDDIESRVCKNCSDYIEKSKFCSNDMSPMFHHPCNDDFGCNCFQRRK